MPTCSTATADGRPWKNHGVKGSRLCKAHEGRLTAMLCTAVRTIADFAAARS
ncbi:MAG: hypothetical protein AB8I52_01545 [Candidatus Promineifilaceae bacterium]